MEKFVETVPRMGGGEIKENSRGVNSSMIYVMNSKNFCKCHNIPPTSTMIKNEKNSGKNMTRVNMKQKILYVG
jgi:hypothetical protein